MLEIKILPARQGDAIWVRWGAKNAPHQMLIDMGTGKIGKRIRNDFLAISESDRKVDLLVISHVDQDHIGGVLTCLAEADPIPGLTIGDIWFNGFEHLTGGSIQKRSVLQPMGPVQGELFSTWLDKHKDQQGWNGAFDGGPVERDPLSNTPVIQMHDGLTLTVLGPTPKRLLNFKEEWRDKIKEALEKGRLVETSHGLERMGTDIKPQLMSESDLRALADKKTKKDGSKANGSSIALLLRYNGRSVLLSGDAYADDLVEAIKAVAGDQRMKIDLFKLPHHGSKKNITTDLVKSVDCDTWIFSTDGTRFKHPDPEAIARIVTYSHKRSPVLAFNARSKYTGWWDNDDWRNRYDYATIYGSTNDGLTFEF